MRRFARPRLLLSLLILAAIAWVGLDAWRVAAALRSAQARLANVEASLARLATAAATPLVSSPSPSAAATPPSSQVMTAAAGTLSVAAADLRRAAAILARYSWPIAAVGALPLVGAPLRAESETATHLLAVGSDAAEGASRALAGLGPAATVLERVPQTGAAAPADLDAVLSEVLAALRTGTPHFTAAQTLLDGAAARAAALETLADGTPPRVLAAALPSLSRLLPRLAQARLALAALVQLPDVLPAAQSARYALVAQKTAELRATGGFWGNIGLLTLENGRVTELDYRKSTDADSAGRVRAAPPAPLARYMQIDQWMLRDANWWPDFPSSAAQLRAFLQEDLGQDVDAVVAFDEEALRRLLLAIGPVAVPDYAERVDAGNVLERLEYHAYGPLEPPDRRAQRPFFEALTESLAAQLLAVPPSRAPALLTAVSGLLAERHLLLSYTHPPLAELVAGLGWDGRVDASSPGDYLYVVDTNVDYTEPYPRVEQTLDYEVTLDGLGGGTALLTLSYANTNPTRETVRFGQRIRRDLSNYLRVYVPAGSEVLRATGLDAPPATWDESGRTVLAGHFFLRAGDRTEVTLEYRLPEGLFRMASPAPPPTAPGNAGAASAAVRPLDPAPALAPVYLLTLQRQPGAPPRPTTLTLRDGSGPPLGSGATSASRRPLPPAGLAWSLRPGAFSTAAPLPPLAPGAAPRSSVPDAGLFARYRLQLETDLRLAFPLPSTLGGRLRTGVPETAPSVWSSGMSLAWLRPAALAGSAVAAAPRPLAGPDTAASPAPAAAAAQSGLPAPTPPAAAAERPAAPGPQIPPIASASAGAAVVQGTPRAGPSGPSGQGGAAQAPVSGAPPAAGTPGSAPPGGPAVAPPVAPPAAVVVRPITPLPPAQRLRIERLGLDAPVIPTAHDGRVWVTADNAVGWLAGTANPGEQNNAVLTAHNDVKGALFARLGELAPGDEIAVDSAAGQFRYRVTTAPTTTGPDDLTVLYPTRVPTLTLITCTPSPTNGLRLVVRAQLMP